MFLEAKCNLKRITIVITYFVRVEFGDDEGRERTVEYIYGFKLMYRLHSVKVQREHPTCHVVCSSLWQCVDD